MQNDFGLAAAAGDCAVDRRRKLRRIARAAEWVACGGMALMGAYSIYLWSDRAALIAYFSRDIPGMAVVPSDGQLLLAYLLSLVPTAIFVAAMWEARGFFRHLGVFEIFDPAAPRRLARLGILAIAAAVAGVLERLLVGIVLSTADPAGPRHLVIAIASSEVSSLIVGLLLLSFALVMQEAVRVADENRSFV